MALPVWTTTIAVERRDDEAEASQDPWDEGYSDEPSATEFATIHEGVHATINSPSARSGTVGPGDSESTYFTLMCDPIDLNYLDEVIDESTDQRYAVEWSVNSPGVGGMLSSTTAQISSRKGA